MASLEDFEELDQESYAEALEQAIAWTEGATDGEKLTYPGSWEDAMVIYDFESSTAIDPDDPELRLEPVDTVLQARAEELEQMDDLDYEPCGRVLAIYLEQSIFDAAATAVSDDFFSNAEIPPTDTWITYLVEDVSSSDEPWYEGILLSYIPERYIEQVQAAIDVVPVDNLEWVEDGL